MAIRPNIGTCILDLVVPRTGYLLSHTRGPHTAVPHGQHHRVGVLSEERLEPVSDGCSRQGKGYQDTGKTTDCGLQRVLLFWAEINN